MADSLALFADRREAGRLLGAELGGYAGERPVVVALPRGGVPVAYEVARALDAPLDVLLVRKLGAPANPEYGIGAIAEGGLRFVRRGDAAILGVSDRDLEEIVARETDELERRRRLYRGNAERQPVEGRTVILVDDGIATGGTALVARRALRAEGAARVVLAVPVGPPGTEERLGGEFDAVVCPEQPHGFFGIGQFYVDFGQVSDEEVIKLEGAREGAAAGPVDPPLGDPLVDPPDFAERPVEIELPAGPQLNGDLRSPERPAGIVIFAHGSGSSRHSPRNREVAEALVGAGFATLLFDLLTSGEELDRANVFDISLLTERLLGATEWARREPDLSDLPIAYFGASTGAAAALRAAAGLGDAVGAVVSRGGRPDLADEALERVVSPTLLIVGGADWQVLDLNEQAAGRMRCEHAIAIVPGATHLFEEPGALERVSGLAADWLARHLARSTA